MNPRSLLRQMTRIDKRLAELAYRQPRFSSISTSKRFQTTGSNRPPAPSSPTLDPPDPARPPDSRPNKPLSDPSVSPAGPSASPLSSTSTRPGPSRALPNNSRLERYLPRLHALSVRTGTPLSSLGLSFLILHELTAILPLVLFFWIFQALGLGAGMVTWLVSVSRASNTDSNANGSGWDWRETLAKWMEEGSKRVERVGKLYGILGYEKVDKKSASAQPEAAPGVSGAVVVQEKRGGEVAEKVASAIAAYVLVKALLPVRIAASIGFAPAFARFALNPLQKLAMRFRR